MKLNITDPFFSSHNVKLDHINVPSVQRNTRVRCILPAAKRYQLIASTTWSGMPNLEAVGRDKCAFTKAVYDPPPHISFKRGRKK